MIKASESEKNLEGLFEALNGVTSLLILTHNNPDPDAIASALALQHVLNEKLGVNSRIAYQGIIGRAENRALVHYLNYPLQPFSSLDQSQLVPVALVDAQPSAGNVTLRPQSGVVIVIDHHELYEPKAVANFTDLRPELGATSTILVEYLQAAGLEPTPPLATALFYGIKTNTMGLGRNADPADTAAYLYLQARIDVKALAKIEQAQVPVNYFKSFEAALRTAWIYGDVVISSLGPIDYPDLTAEMADLLLRLERSQWVICMGLYEDVLILSVRTHNRRGGAGQLIQAIVKDRGRCGGHGAIAGGQVPLHGQDAEQLVNHLGQQALQYLNISAEGMGQPLISYHSLNSQSLEQ
jgi:nanoRNase/pAp phosphatase (c-di-AMP/oligoRNAs hydrolase)